MLFVDTYSFQLGIDALEGFKQKSIVREKYLPTIIKDNMDLKLIKICCLSIFKGINIF